MKNNMKPKANTKKKKKNKIILNSIRSSSQNIFGLAVKALSSQCVVVRSHHWKTQQQKSQTQTDNDDYYDDDDDARVPSDQYILLHRFECEFKLMF